ncbi:MAG TPA: Ig domain-containing protein, partial [Nitrospira sp.]|nr:Ig domain-containing protein [Nitrospira sp.]
SRTLTVTMTIVDPDNRNGDSNASLHSAATHPFDPAGGAAPFPGSGEFDNVPGNGSIVDPWDSDLDALLTRTNGGYGLNFLTMGIKTANSRERVAFRFTFSLPVRISNLQIGDIDGAGINNDAATISQYESPGNSFQDRVEFYGRNGSVPVQMTVNSGAFLTASNGTVYYTYNTNITGNPTATGTATITATDANGCTGTTSLTINPFACPTITVTPAILPEASVGQPYSETPTASGAGGGASYGWSATSLPAGLSINPTTGLISGTPTAKERPPSPLPTPDLVVSSAPALPP